MKYIKIRKKATNKQKEKFFRHIFVDLVYNNMDMEDETVFSKKDIALRYKLQIDRMVSEGVHKKIVIPKSYV